MFHCLGVSLHKGRAVCGAKGPHNLHSVTREEFLHMPHRIRCKRCEQSRWVKSLLHVTERKKRLL